MADDILDQARSYLEQMPADSPEWQGRIADFLKDVRGIADAKSIEREARALAQVTETGLLEDRTTQNWMSQEPSADSLAALAALRRAAVKARRRAIEATGSVPTWRDGKIVYETEV